MDQYIGIEGGGTKFVCAMGTHPGNLSDRIVIKTRSPHETMQEVVEYIRSMQKKAAIKALGLAVFAPLGLDPALSTYGYITTAPKPGWGYYNIVGTLQQESGLPVGFDTDVNGAALGESRWGAGRNLSDFIYLTVGTGIGGGAIVRGHLVHGAMHPEMGHLFIPQDFSRDVFEGVCPYHKNCLEGLASGPAMIKRWNVASALHLPTGHIAWELEAYYLGVALANYTMTLSPKRIILGGGVMRHEALLPLIRREVLKVLNGYISCERVTQDIENYIVRPELGENAGVCGAIVLAERTYQSLHPQHFLKKAEV